MLSFILSLVVWALRGTEVEASDICRRTTEPLCRAVRIDDADGTRHLVDVNWDSDAGRLFLNVYSFVPDGGDWEQDVFYRLV